MYYRMKKAFFIGIALVLIFVITSCGQNFSADEQNTFTESSENILAEDDISAPESKIETVYHIEYVTLDYISDAEKEAWREPLFRLISNMKEPVVENFDIVGYEAPDPSLPSIEPSRNFGLMDLNMDGVPELLADLGGGTAGNCFYYIYDIMTGEYLGYYNGAGSDSINAYLNVKTGKIELFSKTEYRIGDLARQRSINRISLIENKDNGTMEFYDQNYFRAYYSFDLLYEEEYGYDMKYSEAEYYVNGDSATWDAYYNAYDDFFQDHMRIPEASFVLIRGTEILESGEDRFMKAEKFVDALLSTDQKFFVKPTH